MLFSSDMDSENQEDLYYRYYHRNFSSKFDSLCILSPSSSRTYDATYALLLRSIIKDSIFFCLSL
jgi:adenylate cyclase class IV